MNSRETSASVSNASAPAPFSPSEERFTFSQLWRQRSIARHTPDDAAVWDKRITDSPTRFKPSNYSREFLELANLQPGETVFDMGCGAGTLAIPCAQAGHQVLAADFSGAMLAQLATNLGECDPDTTTRLTTQQLAWADDWEAAGIAEKSFDVAFASRSIITEDLEDSIRKLSKVANKRVCVTVTPGQSPRIFAPLLKALGLSFTGHPDASFVFAVATELGYTPEVRYIRSPRQDYFPTPEAAFQKYREMIHLSDENPQGADLELIEAKLKSWLDEHLIPAAQKTKVMEGDPGHYTQPDTVCVSDTNLLKEDALTTDIDRVITWAFISWPTQERNLS